MPHSCHAYTALNSARACLLPPIFHCRARGMRAPFGEGSAEFMRQQLAEWIDWSLNKWAACWGGQGVCECRAAAA